MAIYMELYRHTATGRNLSWSDQWTKSLPYFIVGNLAFLQHTGYLCSVFNFPHTIAVTYYAQVYGPGIS